MANKHHSDTIYYRIIDSPIDPLLLAGTPTSLHFLLMHDHHPQPVMTDWVYHKTLFCDITQQLEEYFYEARTSFNINYQLTGTHFQQQVWKQLITIPYGHTRTYGDIADQIGNPKASRAVGSANRRNPISIIIPCHRVIGCTGQLTGYAGGIERKKFLLNLEQNNLLK